MKILTFLYVLAPILSGATFFVDSSAGNDSNPGGTPSAAWRSLARVNRQVFEPGDHVLFRSGGVWTGQLAPRGSGRAGAPIVIDKFGGEIKPVLNGSGEVEDTLLLANTEYWEIRNLEITNRGASPAVRRGVHVLLDNFGEAHSIALRRLTIHDVNGDDKHKENGGIIWTTRGDTKPSRFLGLLIEDCFIYRVDRSGIAATSTQWDRRKWFPSLNVIIRRNTLDDIGGDGIVPWASDGALIEHNVLANANSRSTNYNAGIWPWSCDNTVIQFNEVYGTRGTKDGQGFDSDYNSRNTIIQYNYSHDNAGGFVLICDNGSMEPGSSVGNVGTIVRYNISRNDGARAFHLSGPLKDTHIYNNTIFTGPGLDVQTLLLSNWHGWAENTRFTNNIFVAQGTARYGHEASRAEDGTFQIAPGFGPATGTVFDANVFFGNHVNRPEDARAITADPLLAEPELAPKAGSPAIGSGVTIPGFGGKDYRGNSVGRRTGRGAIQFHN